MHTPTTLWRRSGVALSMAAVVATAACSDDQPTAPTSSPKVTTANALQIPQFYQEVTVRIEDINGNLIPDVMTPTDWYSLTSSGDTVKRQVAYDNHLNPEWNVDLNSLVGVMTLKMPYAAKQRVCLYTFADNYAYDMYQPHCNEVATNGAFKVDAGTLVVRRKPVHTFFLKDSFGVPVKGAKIHVKGPSWYQDFVLEDGGFGDYGEPDGKISFRGEIPGTMEWCEVTPPSGYKLTNPTCGKVNMKWEGNTWQTLYHTKKFLMLP